MLSQYVETLSLLGDESRLRLCALLRDRELRVMDLVRVTGISQSRVSTHLGRLRDAGYVRDRREGPQAYYTLTLEGLPRSARAVLEEAAQSMDPTLEGDRERLRELDAERRGEATERFDDLERDYSPGRSWQSLALGLAGQLDLGDVLDVGCGDGAAAACVAPYCRSLACVDTNRRMVEMAGDRLSRYAHAQVHEADVHQLPFRDATFDSVLLFHTLTYAEDPARALRECARVLRPCGRITVLCLDKHRQQHVTKRFGERHPGFTPQAIRQLLEGAGLRVVRAEVACREGRKPHLQVVFALAHKPAEDDRN